LGRLENSDEAVLSLKGERSKVKVRGNNYEFAVAEFNSAVTQSFRVSTKM